MPGFMRGGVPLSSLSNRELRRRPWFWLASLLFLLAVTFLPSLDSAEVWWVRGSMLAFLGPPWLLIWRACRDELRRRAGHESVFPSRQDDAAPGTLGDPK